MMDTFGDRDRLRKNNFGAMRLALAIFVIFSHMFPAFGGHWESKEVLMRLTGNQMDLGALAVNAFFAISGYLITLSWMRTPSLKTFLMKRVLRIYPGFLLASVISIFIVAPLAGAKFSVALAPFEAVKSAARLVFLSAPKAVGAFAGEPWPVLNLPLWTIRYEFICYLFVPLIVLACLRFGRGAVLALYALFMCWHASQGRYLIEDGWEFPIIGSLSIWPKFLAYFLGGMVFAQYRDVIPFRNWIFWVCVSTLVATGIFGGFFVAVASAGIYVIFYLAYQHALPLFTVGTRCDLSYGVYLYGWPVQKLIASYFGSSLTPWSGFAFALPLTLLMAAMSWYVIESPCMREKAKLAGATTPSPGSSAPPRSAAAPAELDHRRQKRPAA